MTFSEVIARTVALATAYEVVEVAALKAAYAEHGTKIGRLDLIRMSDLPAEPPSPEWDALVAFLRSQPPALLDRMTAVMVIGRGDCDAADFAYACRRSASFRHSSEATAGYLAGKVHLGRYLTDGLKELTAAGVDVDGPHGGQEGRARPIPTV